MIEDKLILEIKSVESLTDIHLAQLLTYLRLSHRKLGLLFNFNVLHLKDGIKRVGNNLQSLCVLRAPPLRPLRLKRGYLKKKP
jgi:hypothetical protein